LTVKETACTRVEKEHREALERVAGMTADEAKKQLIQEMESQARLEAVGHAKRTLEEARENAEREAREILPARFNGWCVITFPNPQFLSCRFRMTR
jgi:Domain of unknown function (DUF3552).